MTADNPESGDASSLPLSLNEVVHAIEDINPDTAKELVDLLKNEGARKKLEIAIEKSTHSEISQFSGPIPHPAILSGFEDVLPGAAERILKMAEKEQEHAHNTDKEQVQVVKTELTRSHILNWAGLFTGYSIAFFGLCISGFLIYQGHDTAGAVLGVTDLAVLAGVFVNANKQKNPEKTTE